MRKRGKEREGERRREREREREQKRKGGNHLAPVPLCYLHDNTGRDENVRANLQQYGLEKHYIDVLVADAAKWVWRPTEMFDAIVTDRTLSGRCDSHHKQCTCTCVLFNPLPTTRNNYKKQKPCTEV